MFKFKYAKPKNYIGGLIIETTTNDNSCLIPELWAQEALMILENQLLLGNLVYRDFSNTIAEFGQTVNASRPNAFEGKRKTDADEVTVQAATSTNVPVVLDQWGHVSFRIKDGEESLAFETLVNRYLKGAVHAVAELIDQAIGAQVYRFLANNVGKIGTTPTVPTLTSLKALLTKNNVPGIGRNVIISSNVEADLLNLDTFVEADKVGDDGSALRNGYIGQKFGMQFYQSNNIPSIAAGNTVVTPTINNGNITAGSTVLTIDSTTAPTVGSWCVIEGDMIPHIITASSATSITISPALKYAIADGADVTIYSPGAVNLSAGYEAGHVKAIVVNGFTVAPQRGQLVSFGATTSRYGLVGTPTTTSILLDRPLYADIANTDVVGIGPAGEYGLAMHPEAIALVSRPLATPMPGLGVRSFVANYNDLSLRVTITYDGAKQGYLVTVDCLFGLAVLNTSLGAVVLS